MTIKISPHLDRPIITFQMTSPDGGELWENLTPGGARDLAEALTTAADEADAREARKAQQ